MPGPRRGLQGDKVDGAGQIRGYSCEHSLRDGVWRWGRKEGCWGHPRSQLSSQAAGVETQDLDSTALESSVSYFIDKKIYIHLSIYLSIHPSIFTHKEEYL